MAHLILFDSDLGRGGPEHLRQGPSYVYRADRGSSLEKLLETVAREVPARSVDGMTIYAHASEALVATDTQTVFGVYGFYLGEPVRTTNVGLFAKLAPLFDKGAQRICNLLACQQVYSGGADGVDRNGNALSGDNTIMIRDLAGALNQYVRAADVTQKFTYRKSLLGILTGETVFDFGEWEGNVYVFNPTDGSKKSSGKITGRY